MAEVSIVFVEVDGVDYSKQVKKVYEGKLTKRKPVNLMHRTGSIRTRLRPTVGFDYVITEGVPTPDFENMEGVLIAIIYEDGTRIQYLECSSSEIGEVTYDEENEAVQRFDFISNERQVA